VPSDDLALPERIVMLHIGPHKTGTTTIQGALHNSRKALKEQGARYAGKYKQAYWAARSVVGSDVAPGRRPPNPKVWQKLVAEVKSAKEGRVVVSSEAFAGADDETTAKVIRQLGQSRPVHVVVTLRPLSKIVPSQWQQFTQNSLRKDYDSWLREVFNDEDDRSQTATFWRRHDHGALVARWAKAVGPENLTVLVIDDTDRDFLTKTFEGLLALQPGSLVAPKEVANRSLTLAEIELVRRVNLQIGNEKWAKQAYSKVMKDGVSDSMQINRRPEPDEVTITTPRWAVERASAIAAQSAKAIQGLGVRIIGDIDRITDFPDESAIREGDAPEPTTIPLDAAILAVIGAIHGMDMASTYRYKREVEPEDRQIRDVKSKELLKIVASRTKNRRSNQAALAAAKAKNAAGK
jgi:hypothetical protein